MVDRTSERDLRHRHIGGVREAAIREIFRRMPEYLRPARAAAFDAVVARQTPVARLIELFAVDPAASC